MERHPTIDSYLDAVPEPGRSTLIQLRAAIREMAPDAVEGMGYGIPGYKYHGKVLIYFGAAKKHLALCAVPGGTMRFGFDELPDMEFVCTFLASRMAEIDTASGARQRVP